MYSQQSGSGTSGHGVDDVKKPDLHQVEAEKSNAVIKVIHPELHGYQLYCEGNPALLFTDNETNTERIFGTGNQTPFVKDGINNYIVNGNQAAVNPENIAAPKLRLIIQSQ